MHIHVFIKLSCMHFRVSMCVKCLRTNDYCLADTPHIQCTLNVNRQCFPFCIKHNEDVADVNVYCNGTGILLHEVCNFPNIGLRICCRTAKHEQTCSLENKNWISSQSYGCFFFQTKNNVFEKFWEHFCSLFC